MLSWAQKWLIHPILSIIKNVRKNQKQWFKIIFSENLMNREKFKSVDFGAKNGPFTLFWAKQEFFSKKGSVTF